MDYLHIMADLLRDTLKQTPAGTENAEVAEIPRGLCGLDIGTGATDLSLGIPGSWWAEGAGARLEGEYVLNKKGLMWI